jgi:hypothetical protein
MGLFVSHFLNVATLLRVGFFGIRISGRKRVFFFFSKTSIKFLGCEVGDSPSSSVETKNGWSHDLATLALFLAVRSSKYALLCLRCKWRITIMGATG